MADTSLFWVPFQVANNPHKWQFVAVIASDKIEAGTLARKQLRDEGRSWNVMWAAHENDCPTVEYMQALDNWRKDRKTRSRNISF